MENASKALIIAGSILVSILIVGLGVIIYNNVAGIASGGSLDKEQINAHNSPFLQYEGTTVSGSNVKALISSVSANNRAAEANDEKIGNYIYLIDDKNAAVTSSSIKTGRTYNVKIADGEATSDEDKAGTTYWKNGYIKTMVITVNADK